MHELSLIRSLLKQVARIQQENKADCVTEIRVEVGPLSGVEPLLLASAFEQLAPDALMDEAELVIEEVPLEATCRQCQSAFEVVDFCFRCPRCQASEIQVLRGDELQLSSVTLGTKPAAMGAPP